MKLPRTIVPIENHDKDFHESWKDRGDDPDLMNVPHPFQMCISGRPGSGKTCALINMILHQDPPFERVFILHADRENTTEYDPLWKSTKQTTRPDNIVMLESIPKPDEWFDLVDGHKSIVIIDDVDLSGLDKVDKSSINRLFGYCSTHCNLSVCATNQIFFKIPSDVRRQCNFFVLYKLIDTSCIKNLATRCGIKNESLMKIFDEHLQSQHDAIWLDYTKGTPCNIRKNCFTPIQ